MAEVYSGTDIPNGGYVEVDGDDGVPLKSNGTHHNLHLHVEELTLCAVLHRLISTILFPNPAEESYPVVHRIKGSFADNVPLLREALENTGRDVLMWTRRGSPLRALLVVSVGTITLLALTGLIVFMLFFLLATFNAIVISLLVSLAAIGGFLAIFFACMAAIYIGAVSVAFFVISTATISAVIAMLIASAWIGFLCIVWLVAKKSIDLAKHSLSMTGSALSVHSTARHANHHEPSRVSD